MKSKKIFAYIAAAAALFVCVFCSVYLINYYHEKNLTSSLSDYSEEVNSVTEEKTDKPESSTADKSEKAPAAQDEDSLPPETAVDSPVDFDELSRLNPHIYGWISIPNTMIDYPVLQHPTNDKFYLNHGADGRYYTNGSIFSEAACNSRSFDDPFTVIYGHDISNSTEMFSQLNNFADSIYFDEHHEFYIYTQDKAYHYDIFAAFPFGRKHLIKNGYFANEESFNDFFDTLTDDYPMYSNYRTDIFPKSTDNILTLSTCFSKNHSQRYLVMAVCTDIYDIAK